MSTPPDTVSPIPGLSPLEPGDPPTIGPYPVVGRIGAGGMGAVYGALDVYGRCVAVKTVHADFARQDRFREAFTREVEMLGRADGISTARLHAADTSAAVPWLAFDYVAGRDLRAYVRAFGPLEGDMLRTFALGTAEGLAALHAAGIAHRDIKPGNVILSPDGPKIVDFGIAVDIGTDRSTDASASYGTPGWSAPERYSGAAADPAADVFAWGGLVILAATGHQPFGAGDAGELARRVRSDEYDVDGVPEDLLGLVEAALSVEPDQRPSSEALVRALLPDDGESRMHGVAETLRRMLGAYWRGVDDAGHDPTRWAGALAAVSAAGLGATALGGGVGTGLGIGATAAGTPGMAAGAAPAAAPTAAAGTFGGGSSTGGVMGGLAGSKLAMTGAGLLAVAVLSGGGYFVYEQSRTSPTEWVTTAARTLEEGAGFTATVERVPVDGGEPINEEYLYSATDRSFLIRGAAMGPGTSGVANHQGELYVYAPREEDHVQLPQPESPERVEIDPSVEGGSVAATLVTAPLRALAEEGGAEEVERRRVFAGPTVLGLLDEGTLIEEEAIGRVELDEEGVLVRAEYTTDRWDVRVDFDEVDAEVELDDPQVWAAENEGFGWSVAHAPLCGTVLTESWLSGEQQWDVQASAWEMDCDYAMEVAELQADPGIDLDRFTTLDDRIFGDSTVLIDETMACAGYPYRPCQDVTVELSRDDEGRPVGLEELELAPVTLIDFHERA